MSLCARLCSEECVFVFSLFCIGGVSKLQLGRASYTLLMLRYGKFKRIFPERGQISKFDSVLLSLAIINFPWDLCKGISTEHSQLFKFRLRHMVKSSHGESKLLSVLLQSIFNQINRGNNVFLEDVLENFP